MYHSLPGRILSTNPNCDCDDCDGVKAVVAIQGETDSFGYETIYWCQTCYDEYKNADPVEESCERCGMKAELSPYRNIDEYNGPVIELCPNCLSAARKRDAEFIDMFDDDEY